MLAGRAASKTFHYTNAAPQHGQLNQRTWLELEDFVLFRFTPTTVRYVGGFARAATLRWDEIREAH